MPPRKPLSRPPERRSLVEPRMVHDLYLSIFGREPGSDMQTALERLRAYGFSAKRVAAVPGKSKEQFETNASGEYALLRVLATRKGWSQLTAKEKVDVTGRIVEGIIHEIIREGRTPVPFFEQNKTKPKGGESVLERLKNAQQVWEDYAKEDQRILASFASIKKIKSDDRKKVDLYERKFLQARVMADYHRHAVDRYLAMLGSAGSGGSK